MKIANPNPENDGFISLKPKTNFKFCKRKGEEIYCNITSISFLKKIVSVETPLSFVSQIIVENRQELEQKPKL